MGAIWFRGREFPSALSEMVGFKTGLAVSENRLRGIVDEIDPELWPPEGDSWMRIRAETFESTFVAILHKLGAGPPRPIVSPVIEVHRRQRGDPRELAVVEALVPRLTAFLGQALTIEQPETGIDPDPFLKEASNTHGDLGLGIALELLECTNAYLFQSPFNRIRRVG